MPFESIHNQNPKPFEKIKTSESAAANDIVDQLSHLEQVANNAWWDAFQSQLASMQQPLETLLNQQVRLQNEAVLEQILDILYDAQDMATSNMETAILLNSAQETVQAMYASVDTAGTDKLAA